MPLSQRSKTVEVESELMEGSFPLMDRVLAVAGVDEWHIRQSVLYIFTAIYFDGSVSYAPAKHQAR